MSLDRFALGLDGSRLSTGFALLRHDGVRVQSGAWTLEVPPKRHRKTLPDEEQAPPGAAWGKLWAHLDAMLAAFPRIVVVGYELAGQVRSRPAALSVYGAMAVIECWCQTNGLASFGCNATEHKLRVTNNGAADKDDMIACARHRWGADCITSTDKRQQGDEADALWLAEWVLDEIEVVD